MRRMRVFVVLVMGSCECVLTVRLLLCAGWSAAPTMWPKFVFTNRFFNQDAYGPAAIDDCLRRCHQRRQEVAGRSLRLQQVRPV